MLCELTRVSFVLIVQYFQWNDNYRVSRTSHSKSSSIVFYAGNNEFGVKTHKNINYHSAVGASISVDVTEETNNEVVRFYQQSAKFKIIKSS